MENYQIILVYLAGFTVIALASKQIGQFFVKVKMPLISGFLFAGMLAGPYVLGLIPAGAPERLRFVDELSLAFIAFAAGSELYLSELKERFKSITWVTIGLVVATFTIGTLTVLALADFVPFMRDLPVTDRLAVALLAGAILVARSPSSAIAIINEMRAKGTFTQTVMGVTVIMDVVVIALFAVNSSIADALVMDTNLDLGFVLLLLGELSLSLALGYVLGKVLQRILSRHINGILKTGLILLAGYSIFILHVIIRDVSQAQLPFDIAVEPLLVCMIGSFLVTNYSNYRTEFLKILHDSGPPIYIAFFTLTGASLALDVLAKTWLIALALFLARLVAIFIGSFGGGMIAQEPASHNRVRWMAFVTQAGVGLGLAKEVVVEFPEWGTALATVIISVIILNQIVGPPLFKWVINLVGEAHTRAETPEFDGERDALIFGLESQALALARQLTAHGWNVKIACSNIDAPLEVPAGDISVCPFAKLDLEALKQLGAEHAEAIVTLLSDEENYQICALAYEHFGTRQLVVRLHDRKNFDRFHELGALIVDPATAIIGLLEHLVRSPAGTSLLLGMEEGQDIVDLEVRNPALHGLALRDLRLPLDTLILSVQRHGHTLLSHGYTRLELGDMVTVAGSDKSLEAVALKFEK